MNDTTTTPTVGQKVIAVVVTGAESYNGHVCTVTHAEGTYLRGEFTSLSKPDDTMSFGFSEWRALPTVGDRIRYVRGEFPDYYGGEGIVERDDHSGLPLLISVDTSFGHRSIWAKYEDVEVITDVVDGHTLTVSDPYPHITRDNIVGMRLKALSISGYDRLAGQEFTVERIYSEYDGESATNRILPRGRFDDGGRPVDLWVKEWEPVETPPASEYVPSIDEYVKVTGILTDDGIVEGRGDEYGHVRLVDNGVWIVETPAGNRISGPGYVFPVIEEIPAVPVEPAIITDLQERITFLERQNAILMTSVDNWTRDFDTYAEAILQEAQDRSWCDEYERVISRIQMDLRVASIPDREQEFEVEVEVEGTIRTTTTVTVTARTQEDADEMVSDDVDSYVDDVDTILTDAARHRSFEDVSISVA